MAHDTRLIVIVRLCRMQGATVIPYEYITWLPLMKIGAWRLTGEFQKLFQWDLCIIIYAGDTVGVTTNKK